MPDIENMDPQELKENLKNPEFRKLLESHGVDVNDIEEQLQ